MAHGHVNELLCNVFFVSPVSGLLPDCGDENWTLRQSFLSGMDSAWSFLAGYFSGLAAAAAAAAAADGGVQRAVPIRAVHPNHFLFLPLS